MSSCTERLRLELKDDLKPLVSLSTNVALMQETLKAVQETLKAVQETQKAQRETLNKVQETLKAQESKSNALLLVGLIGTGAILYKTL